MVHAQQDDVVLVTGSASGIGRAITHRFDEAGWTVYATDKETAGLDGIAARGCETIQLDVTDTDAIRRVVREIHKTHGAIDCLVNNAGYGVVGPVADIPAAEMAAQFDVNVYGPLRLCRAVLPAMHQQGTGRIINISSIFGRIAFPGMGAYSASKHGIEAVSETLRHELTGTGIDISVIEPAWVRTDFARQARRMLTERERTSAYSRVYTLLEKTPFLGGGPFAVSPEQVATTVYEAATTNDPALRYPVGWQARVLLAMRYLPDSILERVARSVLRIATMCTTDEGQ